MEEAFKNMEDGDYRGGCSTSASAGVGEGAEEILDGFMEGSEEVGQLLDCDLDNGSAVGLPAWEGNVVKAQGVLECVDGMADVLGDAAQEVVGRGEDIKVLGELESGKEAGVSRMTTVKVALDWKKAVLGGLKGKGGAAERELALLCGDGVEDVVVPSCGKCWE